MEELVPQADGCYALCFKNHSNISNEDVQNKFSEFGHVHSIRTSNDPIPWVFIRYKGKEDAQDALNNIKGLDIRIAKSNAKKLQEQEGEHHRRSDSYASENKRENRTIKGNQSRNKQSDKFTMNSEDNAGGDTDNGSPKRSQSFSLKSPKTFYQKQSEGREEAEESHRKNDCPLPRLVRKSPGNHANGAIPRQRLSGDNGPPKLVKASEYYATEGQGKSSSILALKAAYQEVWSNHPLHNEMKLWEVVLTNFQELPSKKDIYKLCDGINLLHVSMGKTFDREFLFCRVLVATEDDAKGLYDLSGTMFNDSELVVTCLEDLLEMLLE